MRKGQRYILELPFFPHALLSEAGLMLNLAKKDVEITYIHIHTNSMTKGDTLNIHHGSSFLLS